MSETIYTLKTSFGYSSKGDTIDATFLSLSAPNFLQIDKVAPIKQAFVSAISSMKSSLPSELQEVESEGEDEAISAKQCMQVLYASAVDISKVLQDAQKLLVSGVVLVDGEIRLTRALLEKLTMEDFEGVLGEYIANFIMPSLADGQ
jgi:hypothetical protein